jgi:N-acetylglucosamine-6-phosphate deacetylase
MTAPYFDMQVNGFGGVDFQQDDLTPAMLDHAVAGLLAHGTGRILLTLVTDTIDRLCRRLEGIERLCRDNSRARGVIVGYHLEGPWLSPEEGYHGAHDPGRMSDPDPVDFERLWSASGGRLRLITLAPERRGSGEVIAAATRRGVRTSIGHSAAGDADIDTAIAAGLTLCTHLGNAVPMQLHRHHNVIQRLLGRDELTAVFIPDGIHLPPVVLRNFVRAKPPGKVLFATDCMAAAGAGPGRFTLGPVAVEVGADGVVREPGRANFAGSALTMDRGVANVRAFLGWSEAAAVAACSTRVADALGFRSRVSGGP